ncbi:MAG: polymer-forming cytoskeletal protein [Pararhodobacter sp.]
MFSKSRINETAPRPEASRTPEKPAQAAAAAPRPSLDLGAGQASTMAAPKSKPAASVLSADLQVTGNIRTSGDVVIEGVVDGDIRAHLLTVGESATIRGEIVADDIVINGRVIGRVRGLKVRLTSTARVEGDIIHKTIAIESGAHFEGSVQRQEDPLAGGSTASARPQPSAVAPQPAPAGMASAQPRPAAPAQPSPSADAAPRPAAPKPPLDTKKAAQ